MFFALVVVALSLIGMSVIFAMAFERLRDELSRLRQFDRQR